MNAIEKDMEKLLAGQSVDTVVIDHVPKMMDHFKPKTKQNICFIVSAVLFNEGGEVLMMQEAKRSCYGEWYLPAGRMEPGETIREGVKREVLEETGLEFEPTALLLIELQQGTWLRFTFTGAVTGGELKTPAKKDQESLQARWVPIETVKQKSRDFPIRASDIFRLIDQGVAYRNKAVIHPAILPVELPNDTLLYKLLMVFQDEYQIKVLVGSREKTHIPVAVPSIDSFLTSHPASAILTEAFNKENNVQCSGVGVLGLEYFGKPAGAHDGFCLNIICILVTPDKILPPVKESAPYLWHDVENENLKELLKETVKPNRVIPLHLLH